MSEKNRIRQQTANHLNFAYQFGDLGLHSNLLVFVVMQTDNLFEQCDCMLLLLGFRPVYSVVKQWHI